MDILSPRHARALRCIVAVPVKDEADRIADCLRAIARQQELQADGIVLLINNTTDDTARVARAVGDELCSGGLGVPVHVVEHMFAPEHACAGAARRMGMEHAASLLGDDGALLTTDADGRVPADWIAANLWHLRAGADAVAGRAVLDAADSALIPAALHEADARECAYAALLDEIAALLDPEPWDPAPRHTEHSGASIAVTLQAYRRAGGMPAASLAEDRLFFAALRRIDAHIRHAPEIAVVVSGRTVGRAEGGMADTIRRRLTHPDPYLDGVLEPAATAARRAWLRQSFRRLRAGGSQRGLLGAVAAGLNLQTAIVRAACQMHYFGEGWAWLETQTSSLPRSHVAVTDLPAEMAGAARLRDTLRARSAEETEQESFAALIESVS